MKNVEAGRSHAVSHTFRALPSSSPKSLSAWPVAYLAGKGNKSIRHTFDANRRRVKWMSAHSGSPSRSDSVVKMGHNPPTLISNQPPVALRAGSGII